jgi:hypothetical protein
MRLGCLALLLVAACASAPAPKAPLAGPWPQEPPSWKQASREYTRKESYSKNWNEVVNVIAVLKAPRWRASYVSEYARRTNAGADAVGKLTATEKEAADTTWQVVLFVATSNQAWNDFARKERSMWRVGLAGDEGREVVPTSVVADRRPLAELQAWYPGMGAFHKVYLVTFPKKTADGQELLGAQKKLTLHIGSGVATVEVDWVEP